ncbi:MAG: ribonuclease HI family protein, partial [Coriobacteriales bacterium]|nr:ribonuclease HI family protein [Coriobacteriales bacterium]
MIKQAILHTDGGSRGNPGPSGIGYVLLADDGREVVTLSEGGAFIGQATNNEAEYQALLWGLLNAKALAVTQVRIHCDSELVVKQVRGEYQVRSAGIKPLHAQVKQVLAGFASYEIGHVYREHNAQ